MMAKIERDRKDYRVFMQTYLVNAESGTADNEVITNTANVYWEMVNTTMGKRVLEEVDLATGNTLGTMPVIEQFKLFRTCHDAHVYRADGTIRSDSRPLTVTQVVEPEGHAEARAHVDWRDCQVSCGVDAHERTSQPETESDHYNLARFLKFRITEKMRALITDGVINVR